MIGELTTKFVGRVHQKSLIHIQNIYKPALTDAQNAIDFQLVIN